VGIADMVRSDVAIGISSPDEPMVTPVQKQHNYHDQMNYLKNMKFDANLFKVFLFVL
jgi:hypothetical protein